MVRNENIILMRFLQKTKKKSLLCKTLVSICAIFSLLGEKEFSGLFGVLAALALIDVTFAQVSRNIAWLIKEKKPKCRNVGILKQTFFKKFKVARLRVLGRPPSSTDYKMMLDMVDSNQQPLGNWRDALERTANLHTRNAYS